MDLEARVAQLEDERALRDLLARFSFLEDTGRNEEWAALWTEDGVYDMVAVVAGAETVSRIAGRERLLELMSSARPAWMHTHAATVEVRIDGDTAVAHGYTVLHQDAGDSVTAVSAAANRWTFRRVDGRWLISGRVRRQIGTAGFTEVLADDPLAP